MTAELDLAWHALGNCRTVAPDTMFPTSAAGEERAQQVCAGCTVKGVCLAYATTNAERFGVWGGKTEADRGWGKVRGPVGRPRQHGTRTRYAAGCSCEPCRAAGAIYQRYQAARTRASRLAGRGTA